MFKLFSNIRAVEKLAWLTLLTLLVIFLMLISVNFNMHSQIPLGWIIFGISFLFALAFYFYRSENFLKKFLLTAIIILASFNVFKYFYWRTTVSLVSEIKFPDFIPALMLYLAEAYAVFLFFTGIFASLRPLNRKVIPLNTFKKDELPTVDVFIPTYNEPLEVLAPTVLNALKLEYPKDKLKVYILDDGGTDQKCNDPDPEKAKEARERRKKLQEFAKKVGAIYLTRKENTGAKAGNINEALKKTNGDLILILDADHIPAKDFLENTVGWFIRDPNIFLVQTPHAFYNPDPIEKNLRIFEHQPQENEMFYKWLQKGLDFWNSSFFCGSAALIRRKYLESLGGLPGDSITEDAETALLLHSKGLKSAYIGIPMIRGLQPETFSALVTQRIRWAQGMVQIFLLKNPLLLPLKWYQKLNYLAASVYWFFGFARFIFLIAPFFFVFFGMKIYNASVYDVLALPLPALFSYYLVSFVLYRNVRAFLSSEVYESVLSLFIFPALISVIRNPRSPTFKVTPKGERVERNFVSQLFLPVVLLWILTIIGIVTAFVKFFLYTDQRYAYAINLGWLFFNFVNLTAGLAIVSEKAEKRKFFRVKLDAEVEIIENGKSIRTKAIDISLGGIAVELTKELKNYLSRFKEGEEVEFIITNPARESRLLKGKFYYASGEKLVFTFDYTNLSFQEFLSEIIFGRADNWIVYERRRPIDYFILIKKLPEIPKLVYWKDIFTLTLAKLKELIFWRRILNA
ncbi:UDP-forming cellulose synthase catalytic subunit [Aquifex pyrophilus]